MEIKSLGIMLIREIVYALIQVYKSVLLACFSKVTELSEKKGVNSKTYRSGLDGSLKIFKVGEVK